MDLKNKQPEDFMFDLSNCEWSDENMSQYWKDLHQQISDELKQRNWTTEDTKSLYPGLTADEAKEAWVLGW